MKMLALTLALGLFNVAHVFADTTRIEFDEKLEAQCYEEVKAMKCTTTDGEPVLKCVNSNISKMSATCRSLYKAKNP